MKRASLVFPVQGGCIWLAKKKSKIGAGLFNGWGGKEEPEDEGDIVRTAIREFREETGGAVIECDSLKKVAIIDFYEARQHIFECHVFFCNSWQGEIRETETMGKPSIYSLGSIPFEKMMPADRVWLDTLLKFGRIRASIYYSEGNTRAESIRFSKPL